MKIVVNGTTVEIPDGSDVSVVGDQVIVNNKGTKFSGDLKIEVIGGLINLRAERGSVTVNGDVKGNVDASGSITVKGNVGGKADASGNIQCGDVNGSVDAGGNIMCGKISGDADAGGNIIGGR